jgi:hypothetical protein
MHILRPLGLSAFSFPDFVNAAKLDFASREKSAFVLRRKLVSGFGSPVDSTGLRRPDLLVTFARGNQMPAQFSIK